jgi:hypothetical protein
MDDREREGYARALLAQHADRELFFLQLAVMAPDDESSRWYEAYADEAYRDALAVAGEHDVPFTPPPQPPARPPRPGGRHGR